MKDERREEFVRKMAEVKEEIRGAGPYHKRDLIKCYNRMKKELRSYDQFHKEAQYGKEKLQKATA